MERPALIERIAPVDRPASLPRERLEIRPAKKPVAPKQRIGGPEPKRTIGSHEIYQLARLRCTKDEAAQFFGLSSTAFSARLHRDFELRLAWDRGAAQSKISLRRQQWTHAQQPGDAGVRMTIHMSKHQLGEVETQVVNHGGNEANPIRIRVEREELIGRIVGNRTIEAGA